MADVVRFLGVTARTPRNLLITSAQHFFFSFYQFLSFNVIIITAKFIKRERTFRFILLHWLTLVVMLVQKLMYIFSVELYDGHIIPAAYVKNRWNKRYCTFVTDCFFRTYSFLEFSRSLSWFRLVFPLTLKEIGNCTYTWFSPPLTTVEIRFSFSKFIKNDLNNSYILSGRGTFFQFRKSWGKPKYF